MASVEDPDPAAGGSEKGGIFETFIKIDNGYEDRTNQMKRFQNKLKERIADNTVFDPELAVSVENFVAEKLDFSRYLRLKLLHKVTHLKSCLKKGRRYPEEYVRDLSTDLKNMHVIMCQTLKDYEENKDVRFYELLLEISRIVSDQKENAKREYFESFKRIDDQLEDLLRSMEMLKDILNEILAAETINDLSLFKVASSVEKYLTEKVDYLQKLRLKFQAKMIDLKLCLKEGSHYKKDHFDGLVSEIKYIDELLSRTLQDYNGNKDVLLIRKLVDFYRNRKKEKNFQCVG